MTTMGRRILSTWEATLPKSFWQYGQSSTLLRAPTIAVWASRSLLAPPISYLVLKLSRLSPKCAWTHLIRTFSFTDVKQLLAYFSEDPLDFRCELALLKWLKNEKKKSSKSGCTLASVQQIKAFPELAHLQRQETTKPPTDIIEAPSKTCTHLWTRTQIEIRLWNTFFSAESQLFLKYHFQEKQCLTKPFKYNQYLGGYLESVMSDLLTWFCVINNLDRSLSQIYYSVHFKHLQVLFIQGNVSQKGSWNIRDGECQRAQQYGASVWVAWSVSCLSDQVGCRAVQSKHMKKKKKTYFPLSLAVE